jgi:hypothetical protein
MDILLKYKFYSIDWEASAIDYRGGGREPGDTGYIYALNSDDAKDNFETEINNSAYYPEDRVHEIDDPEEIPNVSDFILKANKLLSKSTSVTIEAVFNSDINDLICDYFIEIQKITATYNYEKATFKLSIN